VYEEGCGVEREGRGASDGRRSTCGQVIVVNDGLAWWGRVKLDERCRGQAGGVLETEKTRWEEERRGAQVVGRARGVEVMQSCWPAAAADAPVAGCGLVALAAVVYVAGRLGL
jgi:hypothetical protein